MKISPVIVLVSAVFAMLLGSVAYYIYDKNQKNEETRGVIQVKRLELDGLKAKTSRRPEMETRLANIEGRVKDVVEILPLESAMQSSSIRDALTQYSSIAKLDFESYREGVPVAAPAARTGPGAAAAPQLIREFGDRYDPLEVTVVYKGTFFQFLQFLALVEQRKEFLRVDKVTLQPTGTGDEDRILTIQVTLSTFHYKVKS